MPAREITNLGSPFRVSIDRLDARQYYVVDGLFDADDVSEAIVQGLPQPTTTITIGSSDSMVVRALSRKRVLTTVPQGAQGHVAIWEVESSRFFSGSLGYRRTTSVQSGFDRIIIPNFKKTTGLDGSIRWNEPSDKFVVTYDRSRYAFVRSIQTSGLSELAVVSFNAVNSGKYRLFNTIPFLYDHTDITTTPDNQQSLSVVYVTRGPVPAFAAGFWGNSFDLPTPVLGFLDEYVIQYEDPAADPVIGIKVYNTYRNQCPAIPWDP